MTASSSTDDNRLPQLYGELERLSAEAAQWAQVDASSSTEMVHVGSADPEKLRDRMLEVRREAKEKAKEVQAAADQVREEIRRELDRQRTEMETRMREAMAVIEPLQAQVKRMEEGIWTVSLYLGATEEIVSLREGTPAPLDTPLTLRTSVLAMDEEVAAFPVVNGEPDWQGMDYRDVEMFDRWLTEDPAHLDQVLPEGRGIVVFTPRRTEKVYSENPLINSAMNKENFESYWLIRNGENLHRMSTNFLAGATLMPVTSEFTALFRREIYNRETNTYELVDILPGTREWAEAEKAQDTKRRHYMRVALIVQGLIDRTEVLAPLHAGVNVMQQTTYDDGLVVVIDDTDNMIASSREPYYTWIRRLNRELRPGMRLIGTFRGTEWDQYEFRGDRYSSAEGNERLHPHNAERPPTETLLTIEDRKNFQGKKGLVVRYERTKEIYDPKLWVETKPGWGYRGGYRVPEQRASAVILPDDVAIIPFDLVTENEMQAYLDARTERHAYANSFPLLQAAIAAKQTERAAEAPFRDLLTRVLAGDHDQEQADVAPHVDELVHRFKLGNKWHRPLVSLNAEDEAKALRLIRAEYTRIVNSGADEARDAHAVKTLRAHDKTIMFVGRLSSGKYVAFAPQPSHYPAEVQPERTWVREHTTSKTAKAIATREWILPGVRGAKMTALYVSDEWTAWDTMATAKDVLTDAELAQVIADAKVDGMAQIRAERGPRCELLGVGVDRVKGTVVVFAHDGMHGQAKPRATGAKGMKKWFASTVTWERKSSGVVTTMNSRIESKPFSFVYEWGKPDAERVFMTPWKAMNGSHYGPRPVVVEVDTVGLAAAENSFRAARSVNRVVDGFTTQIRRAVQWLNRQQEDVKVEAIKAEFLREMPDEETWDERRASLTSHVRADIELDSGRHFKNRVPVEGQSGSYHLNERTDEHLRIDKALATFIDAGYIEWDGLVVSDVYDLLDAQIPDLYESIASLRLTETPLEALDLIVPDAEA